MKGSTLSWERAKRRAGQIARYNSPAIEQRRLNTGWIVLCRALRRTLPTQPGFTGRCVEKTKPAETASDGQSKRVTVSVKLPT
jgi:hypothetical protein